MSDMTVAELAESPVGCGLVLEHYFGQPVSESQAVRLQAALASVIAPDEPPNAADVQADADDDRPLRVGDRVRVADDARLVSRLTRGGVGTVIGFDSPHIRIRIEREGGGYVQALYPADLTRIGGDA